MAVARQYKYQGYLCFLQVGIIVTGSTKFEAITDSYSNIPQVGQLVNVIGNNDPPVNLAVEGINLSIRAGEKVAICGRSGG